MMDVTRSSQFVSMSLPSRQQNFQPNRSYISTSFATETENYQMRKSRIQNIPNYRKLGLGDNLPFVVVFQTIQIERLSSEIESNRIKIKDFERQIFNSQNYQVQIRQLTQKLFTMQQEKTKYSDEVQKLNLICHQLYNQLEEMKKKYREVDLTLKDKYQMERAHSEELMAEIQRWKVRYMAAEKSKAKELDDLRMMMESQRKSMFDREIRQITIKFQTQRSTLQNEIRKFREALQYKNRQLQENRGKLQRFEIQILQMQAGLSQMTEYQNQLAMLSQQMVRLNQLLKAKGQQIQSYRQREYLLNQKLKQQQQWEFQLKNLRVNLQNRTREIQDWRIRYSKMQQTIMKQQNIMNINNDLNDKILILQQQLQKYEVILQGLTNQLEDWKRKFANQQSQVIRLRNQSTQLSNYQNKVGVLSAEIERLNLVMRNKVSELEQWRNKNSKLQITINNFSNIQRDNQELQSRLGSQTRVSEELKHKIIMMEQQLANNKNLQMMLEEYSGKVMQLNQENERLNGILRGKLQEIDDYKVRYIKIQTQLRDYRGAQLKIREYQNQLAMLTQQIQRMNNLMRAKTDEIQRLNITIRRLQEENGLLKTNQRRIAQSERTIQNLTSKIQIHIRDAGKWQDKCKILEVRNKEFESSAFNLHQEREKLSQQLKAKMFQLDDLKGRFMKVQTDAYKMRELQSTYIDMKNRLNAVTSQLQRVERIAREGQAQIDRQRAISTQLGFKVIVLSAEIQRLSKGGNGMKQTQVKEMHERFMQLQTACTQKDQQIAVIMQKISTLQQQIMFLGEELQKFLTVISNYQLHAGALEQDIIKYQDYAKRIMILSAQIDRLQGQNRGLQEDIKRIRLRYADQISGQTKHESICLMFVLMSVQIQSLRDRMKEKQVQFDQMRKSILEPVRNIHHSYN